MKSISKKITTGLLAIAMAIVFILFLGTGTAHADDKTIASIYVNCDPGIWYILPDKNGNDNYYRLRDFISTGGEGVQYSSIGNLTTREDDGNFWGVNSDSIDPEKQYYLSLQFSSKDGYVWPDPVLDANSPIPITDSTGLRVFFNDERCTDAFVEMYLSDVYINIPIGNDISAAKVSLSKNKYIYNGKKQVPSVTKAVLDGQNLTSKNYTVSYHDMNNAEVTPVKAGDYYVQLEGKGIYACQVQVPFKIINTNPMKASGKTVKIKYKKLKKKTQTIPPGKAFAVSGAQGTVTYKLDSARKGSKKIKLSTARKYFKITEGTGKIQVKKKLKKGTYTLKVKVSASGNESYEAASKTVTVTVKIK